MFTHNPWVIPANYFDAGVYGHLSFGKDPFLCPTVDDLDLSVTLDYEGHDLVGTAL